MAFRQQNILILFLLAGLVCYPLVARAWTGKVVKVTDGDTLTVLREDLTQVKVRLYGIDAPEKRQDFGTKAKQALSDLVFGKVVDVEEIDRDRYGRTVGLVYVDGQVANREMVAKGMAWTYMRYCTTHPICPALKASESIARTRHYGLWAATNPTEPWVWRSSARHSRHEP